MGTLRGNRLRIFWIATLLAITLLAVCSCVLALDPSLDVSQYAHTSWKIREGFTKGAITAIVQTPDGYLWLGTELGLLRFDGVRTVPFQPPPSQRLPSDAISSLLAARDGALWIGTVKGLARWKDGKLTLNPELAGQAVFRLLQDRKGTIWAGAVGFPTGRLCAIQSDGVHCYGQDGVLGPGVVGLYEDSKGNLWAGVKDGLWRWNPGPSNFYPLPDNFDAIRAFAEYDEGAFLISTRHGIRQLVDGKFEPYSLPGNIPHLDAEKVQALLRDRDGGLWIASSGQGLLHVHQGRTDRFSQPDGLSGNIVSGVFEDREGNIWTAGLTGLDRFRDFAVATVSINQGLSSTSAQSVLADGDGSVWLATNEGLDRWNDGRLTVAHTGSAKQDGKLNGDFPNSLFQDTHGRVWVSTLRGFGYLENGRFVPINAVPTGNVQSIAEDHAGNLWLANEFVGLVRLSRHGEVQQIPWTALGHKEHASALVADPLRGGLWIGFYNGGVSYFTDDGIRASYGAADGLGGGHLNYLKIDRDGTLWAPSEGGLGRLKNGHAATLNSNNGLPCDAVHWVIEDDEHSFWLYTACGLVRLTRPELNAWVEAADEDKDTKRKIQTTVFDNSDGVMLLGSIGGRGPKVSKSTDGRLWFTAYDGFSIVDPRHLALNKLPPPVHVEQIIADHKMYDAAPDSNGRVSLPPRVRDLQIDYTALSLVAPEKVFFRYKLEGWDRDWQYAGTQRQAFYSNLPPRKYTFRVKACNNSGVWNEAGAAMDFAIAPAYWQTWWFRLACIVAFAGMLLGVHRLRLHQVEQRINLTLDARVAERTRIARDLHDTLLQSFQGTLLKFQAATYMLPERPDVQRTLEGTIEQARQAITEGRDAVQGMRSSTLVMNDLARAISMLAENLADQQGKENCPEFRMEVGGNSRDLRPIIRDDVYRIAGEALRNAFKHSRAKRIEVEVRYDPRELRVRIRDNGTGIDPKVLEEGGRVGHYGLPGMKERAKLVGGKLEVWSELDSGTEAELTIPSSVAYAKSLAARWQLWRKGA